MIPAPFDYSKPSTLDEAVKTLASAGEDAKVLAGGHSLLPLMRLRLATPEVVVDLGGVAELRGVTEDGDHLRIGAMTTHDEVVHDPLVKEHCGVLAHVTEMVGDPQVRHRGTFGGAIAHGDAAGDQPTAALALDAQMVVRGPSGERTVPAAEFFVDYLETALEPEEILVAVRVPKLQGNWGWHYEKFNRVAQAWAIVGALAIVRRDNGSIGEARIGLTHMGSTPLRARGVEQALAGGSGATIATAAASAAEGTSPPSDLNASADYRAHLAQVLTRRALERAAGS